MGRFTLALATLIVFLVLRQLSAAIRTEIFDTDPGWTVVGNDTNGNDFGYQPNTSYAGGSTGEGGGRFTRSSFVRYYGDTDLGGTFTLDQPFSASGKLGYTEQNWPDFGNTLNIGHFFDNGYGKIGITLTNSGTNNLYWGSRIEFGDGVTTGSIAPPLTLLSDNVNHTWSYEWMPTGGSTGNGLLTAVLDGKKETIDLTASLRAKGASVNSFGIAGSSSGNPRSTWYADIYIDDLSYSVVPEPPTITLLIGLMVSALAYGRLATRE